MVISEPTPFVAGRFEKPLRFASNQQMQINIFSFFKKKKTYSCCSVRAYKYDPRHKSLFDKIAEIVPRIIILRQLRCPPCPICPSNGSFLWFEHVVTIEGRFRRVFRGFSHHGPWLVPPLWDGLSRFMEPSQARLSRYTSLLCCFNKFLCSASSFDCTWLLRLRLKRLLGP